MLRINPIQLNNPYRKNVIFKANNDNMTQDVAVLALQNPNLEVEFKKNLAVTKGADAVQSNPIKALAYKIYQTFKTLFSSEVSDEVANMAAESLFILA